MLNQDEQEAAAEFIGMMKRLQVELDDASNKFAVFQKCAARAEGSTSYYGDYVNGRPTSFGPFQSHFPGIANQMLAAGIDVRDKSTVRAQIEWMKRYGETHGGYSSDIWHGLRGHGGSLPASRRGGGETHVHHHIYLDGKVIARSTSKHFARAATYPTSVGLADGRGQFLGPGAERFALMTRLRDVLLSVRRWLYWRRRLHRMTGVKVELEHSGHKILERTCVLLEDSAKEALGTYEFGWAPLKPETIARKVTGDSPLLETGAMRQSIEHNVDANGKEAAVGTDLDYAKYLEFGTSKMPCQTFPRRRFDR